MSAVGKTGHTEPSHLAVRDSRGEIGLAQDDRDLLLEPRARDLARERATNPLPIPPPPPPPAWGGEPGPPQDAGALLPAPRARAPAGERATNPLRIPAPLR